MRLFDRNNPLLVCLPNTIQYYNFLFPCEYEISFREFKWDFFLQMCHGVQNSNDRYVFTIIYFMTKYLIKLLLVYFLLYYAVFGGHLVLSVDLNVHYFEVEMPFQSLFNQGPSEFRKFNYPVHLTMIS